jgi:hypothetical protein
MKKVHMFEVKLIDGTVHRGEIVYKDNDTIILKLTNKQTIRLSKDGIMLIKDLGWKKVKK